METATVNTQSSLSVVIQVWLATRVNTGTLVFGTKEHMAKVLADINCDKVFAVKGDKTAMRSFYNWPRNMRILLQS